MAATVQLRIRPWPCGVCLLLLLPHVPPAPARPPRQQLYERLVPRGRAQPDVGKQRGGSSTVQPTCRWCGSGGHRLLAPARLYCQVDATVGVAPGIGLAHMHVPQRAPPDAPPYPSNRSRPTAHVAMPTDVYNSLPRLVLDPSSHPTPQAAMHTDASPRVSLCNIPGARLLRPTH